MNVDSTPRPVRVLHTADWHLGYRLGRHDRRGDTLHALESLIGHAQRERPDVILHAGDIFHDERPGQTAVADAVEALTCLADTAPVIVAAGNHDGRGLLASLDVLAGEGDPQRIVIAAEPAVIAVNEDAEGALVAAAVPWLSRGDALRAWTSAGNRLDDPERPPFAAWAAGRIRAVADEAQARAGELADASGRRPPVVLLIHAHAAGAVTGALRDRAERGAALTGEYALAPEGLPDTAYTAAGHIHDAQTLGPAGRTPLRYAGSVIRMSFGERAGPKTAAVVDLPWTAPGGLRPGAQAEPRLLEIAERRPLVDFTGPWDMFREQMTGGGFDDCILRARIRSADRLHDLADEIRRGTTDCAMHDIVNEVENPGAADAGDLEFEETAEPPLEDLYRDWRRDRGRTERGEDDRAVDLFKTALATVRELAPPRDPFGVDALRKEFGEVTRRLQDPPR